MNFVKQVLGFVCGGARPSAAMKRYNFSEGRGFALIYTGIAYSLQEELSLLYS